MTPAQLLRLQEIERTLVERGLAPVLADIRLRRPATEWWTDLLRNAWVASSIAEVQLTDTSVPAFRGRYHDEIARELSRARAASHGSLDSIGRAASHG